MEDARQIFTQFLLGLTDEQVSKMRVDSKIMPPIIVYEDDKKFIAMDPTQHRFFVDPNYLFEVSYNFESDPTIQKAMENLGIRVMEKSRYDAVSQWVSIMSN